MTLGECNKIAERVIGRLKRRIGFDHWWDSVDEDIQDEIIREIGEMIWHIIHDKP